MLYSYFIFCASSNLDDLLNDIIDQEIIHSIEIPKEEILSIKGNTNNFTLIDDAICYSIDKTLCVYDDQLNTYQFEKNITLMTNNNIFNYIVTINTIHFFNKNWEYIQSVTSPLTILAVVNYNLETYCLCAGNVIFNCNTKEIYYSPIAASQYKLPLPFTIYKNKLYFWNLSLFSFNFETKKFSNQNFNRLCEDVQIHNNTLYINSPNELLAYSLEGKEQTFSQPEYYKMFFVDQDVYLYNMSINANERMLYCNNQPINVPINKIIPTSSALILLIHSRYYILKKMDDKFEIYKTGISYKKGDKIEGFGNEESFYIVYTSDQTTIYRFDINARSHYRYDSN